MADEKPPSRRAPSRRRFLKLSAAATVAGAGAPLLGSAAAPAQPARAGTPGFEHLVVLMFENRSFDNLLGHLYPPGSLPAGQTFAGAGYRDFTNPSPSGPIPFHVYRGATDRIMQSPNPDPGEQYPHVNTQLFGTVDPPGNAKVDFTRMRAPFNAPAAGTRADMSGFVKDYINNFTVTQRRPPRRDEYEVAMGGFSAEMLPVVSTLARGFAVYDAWFCAVPSQTFCNRAFFNASTSSGFVTNKGRGGYLKWMKRNPAPTIFNRLHDAGISWAVYFDPSQVVSLTGFINGHALAPFWKSHFRGMKQFHEDAAAGRLPAYAFIEPRLLFDHNDMHPPVPSFEFTEPGGKRLTVGATSDVRAGEKLLHEVYTSIRHAATPNGSNAMNTLLLVTFDEHGGTYDHVPPPVATPPGPMTDTEMGFGFDRLGVRVPTIAISAYTRAGTIIHDEMHHGAAIATLCRKYGLPPLTARDANARDLSNAINLAEPRPAADWPDTVAPYVPPNPHAHGPFSGPAARMRLTPPAQSLVGMLVQRFGLPRDREPTTFGEAYEALYRLGKGLFG
jgi:phospholipase C